MLIGYLVTRTLTLGSGVNSGWRIRSLMIYVVLVYFRVRSAGLAPFLFRQFGEFFPALVLSRIVTVVGAT